MSAYSVQSWDHFCACVTPEELAGVLTDFRLVKSSGLVPEGYRETPVAEYAKAYGDVLDCLRTEDEKSIKEAVVGLDNMAIIRELPDRDYKNIHDYRRAALWEPYGFLGLFTLKCLPAAGQMTLSTSFLSWIDPQDVVGVKFHCPKSLLWRQGTGYSDSVSTQDMVCWKYYLDIKQRLQSITKPLRVELEGREVRTKIRVSDAMLEELGELYFFRNNSIRVINKKTI